MSKSTGGTPSPCHAPCLSRVRRCLMVNDQCHYSLKPCFHSLLGGPVHSTLPPAKKRPLRPHCPLPLVLQVQWDHQKESDHLAGKRTQAIVCGDTVPGTKPKTCCLTPLCVSHSSFWWPWPKPSPELGSRPLSSFCLRVSFLPLWASSSLARLSPTSL